MKRRFKSRADRCGYIFGKVLKTICLPMTLIFLFCIPSEQIVINKNMILPAVFSGLLTIYGSWRTGGLNDED